MPKDTLALITGFDDDLDVDEPSAKPSKELLQQLATKLPWQEDKSNANKETPVSTSVRAPGPSPVRLSGPQSATAQNIRQPGVYQVQRPGMRADAPRQMVVRQ